MIDKDKATEAVHELENMKAISPEVAMVLKGQVASGESAEETILSRLGIYFGGRFLAEEYVERVETIRSNVKLCDISIAELLIDELRCRWHEGLHINTMLDWWCEEAAEPWHPSLRGMFDPSQKPTFPLSPKVSCWFNMNSEYFQIALRVLGTCYK